MDLGAEVQLYAEKSLREDIEIQRVSYVPEGEDGGLPEDLTPVKFNATVLYLELRYMDSLMETIGAERAIALQRILLYTIERVAASVSGEVRALQNDHAVIFFPGTTKAMVSNAVRCAMHFVYLFSDEESRLYRLLKQETGGGALRLDFGIGMDYGEVVCMRFGGDKQKRLIWLGKPVKKAKALGMVSREVSKILASKYICENLQERVKYYKGENMWGPMDLSGDGFDEICYYTNFRWSFE